MRKKILVTGGLGYIGSHTTIQLLTNGYDVVCIDNLSNSKRLMLARIAEISGRSPSFVLGDVRDPAALSDVFARHDIESVIHFAGLKAVGESVREPLKYYDHNVAGTLNLLETMNAHNVRQIVFSSSATVYGDPESVPIFETAAVAPTNPYGWTKLHVEQMLRDLSQQDGSWRISILRYFNPVGAHPSGRIGEDPLGVPNNLMPFIAQVAVGRRTELSIFGNDYDTRDGTGVRDYIHVMDLADGHIAALKHGERAPGCHTFNLGTGDGRSVLEMVEAFEKASGKQVPYQITARRPGDIATCFANCDRAKEILKWSATRSLEQMAKDTWTWQESHPNGLAAERDEGEQNDLN